MLRESICYSETLAGLSAEAERLFYRLLTQADDFGRFDARPCVVRSRCFQLGGVSDDKVMGWLTQLRDNRVVCLYEVDGKDYGHFPTWEKYQRMRSPRSRYPDPPHDAATCGELPQVAAECGSRARASGTGTRTRSKNLNSNSYARASHARDSDCDVFWEKLYPKPVKKADTYAEWRKQQPTLAAIEAALEWQRGTPDWQRENGRFIPGSDQYLKHRRWEDTPPTSSPFGTTARTAGNAEAIKKGLGLP